MTFNTRFSLHDEVWICHGAFDYEPVCRCPVCKGTGENIFSANSPCRAVMISDDAFYTCVNGMLSKEVYSYRPSKVKIASISVWCDADAALEPVYDETYGLAPSYGSELSLNEIFPTQEECQAECDRKNANEMVP